MDLVADVTCVEVAAGGRGALLVFEVAIKVE